MLDLGGRVKRFLRREFIPHNRFLFSHSLAPSPIGPEPGGKINRYAVIILDLPGNFNRN